VLQPPLRYSFRVRLMPRNEDGEAAIGGTAVASSSAGLVRLLLLVSAAAVAGRRWIQGHAGSR
jgi:hypothetical protein